jgi:uncharacterized OsmC-like protein
MTIRDTEDHVVVNHAAGEMVGPMATALHIREFPPFLSDEPSTRGGNDRGPTPLELLLASLCACTRVSTARMAAKLRFKYSQLEASADGELDTRGRKGLADVPVHYRAVHLHVKIATDEPEKRLGRLADLVGRYCPVDSLIGAAVPDYEVTWERLEPRR